MGLRFLPRSGVSEMHHVRMRNPRSLPGVVRSYRELREDGQRQALLPLLRHADAMVRCWSAAHALEFAPDQGEGVLRATADQERGVIGFTAEQTLNAWREGELRLP